MINLIKISICFFVLALVGFLINKGQYNFKEKDFFKPEITLIKNYIELNNKPILVLPKRQKLDAVTFGYLPEWIYEKNGSSFRYDLISHIAVFSFNLNRKFEIKPPKHWPWNDVIDSAQIYNTKLIMTVFSEDSNQIHKVMMDFETKDKFFSDLLSFVKKYKFDGVNIDFESVKWSDRGGVINHFMQELTDFLHHEVPGSEVSISGPAVNWYGLWDLYGLAKSCDYIFIMGYCFFGSWSDVTGPSSTLSGRQYCLDSTISSVNTGYGLASQYLPEKLILGIPFFGNHWITKTSEPHSEKIRHIKNKTYYEISELIKKYKRNWQEDYQVPWLRFKVKNDWHQVWYDDAQSLGLKYDLAVSKGLKGIGIWALGFDNNDNEIWSDLDYRFRSSMPIREYEKPSLSEDILLVKSKQKTDSTTTYKLVKQTENILNNE